MQRSFFPPTLVSQVKSGISLWKRVCLRTGNGQTARWKLKFALLVHLPNVCYFFFGVAKTVIKNTINLTRNLICFNHSSHNRKWRLTRWNPLNTTSVNCLSSVKLLCLDLFQFLRSRGYKIWKREIPVWM